MLFIKLDMKIESKFRDYYDAGLVYWIDEKLYFKREQIKKEVHLNFSWGKFRFRQKEKVYELEVYPYVIWFCWCMYPLVHIK